MSVNYVDKTTGELVTLANGTRMWIGTKEAHDLAVQQGTMPNNCMVCITNDAAGEEAWEYSTSETNTGKKWIDGKPIYRKVVNFGTLPNATTKSVAHGVTDLDTWTSIKGVAQVSTSAISLPYTDIGDVSRSIACAISAGNIIVDTGTLNRADYLGYFILEYTKTTD